MTRSRTAPLALAAAYALSGCTRAAQPAAAPSGIGTTLTEARAAHGAPRVARRGHRGEKSRQIPDGPECLEQLEADDIAFHELAPRAGMTTPVAVTGPIGGVRYEMNGNGALVCDCRLAVALDEIGPELRGFGVEAVRHSGAYVYRTTKRGGPSLHARGLAIDVHEVRVGTHRLNVLHDYARGETSNCAASAPLLNRLACELDRTGLFQQVLTPDDNYDHRDHVHLAIAPL